MAPLFHLITIWRTAEAYIPLTEWNHVFCLKHHSWRNFWESASIKSERYLCKDFIQKVSRFPKLPSLYRPSQFNLSSLNGSLESISGPQECHYLSVTPPLPNLQSNLQPQNPDQWHGDHLNGSCCGKILCLPPCVKRSRMFGYYSPQCSGRWRKVQKNVIHKNLRGSIMNGWALPQGQGQRQYWAKSKKEISPERESDVQGDEGKVDVVNPP